MTLPETGFLRLNQILGDKKKEIPALLPIGRTAWYEGIKKKIYPEPIKLSERTSVYRVEDIKALIKKLGEVN